MVTTTATTGERLHALIQRRRGDGERLWAIADAARDRELAFSARDRFDETVRTLFDDNAPQHMSDVAPYLFPIECHSQYPFAGSEHLDFWAGRFGNSAGILFLTEADPDRLVIHLRNVFRATDEDGHRYYFRFYDPRVLRTFLPVCTEAEAAEFFGPIGSLFVEGQAPDTMLVCSAGRSGTQMDETPLGTPSGDEAEPGGE